MMKRLMMRVGAVVAGIGPESNTVWRACTVTLSPSAEGLICSCDANPTSSSVWGTGTYTAGSDICTAARHDGALGRDAASVTVLRIGGLDVYGAIQSNGITPTEWWRYSESMVFDRYAN